METSITRKQSLSLPSVDRGVRKEPLQRTGASGVAKYGNCKALFVSILFFFCISLLSAQIPAELIKSIQTGNANVLSGYFNQNIEMVVLQHDDVYSKAQAKEIITTFFSQHKAQGFSILHEGGKDGSQYAIGTLKTDKGSFRVYFLLKNTGNQSFVHQLRIEKQ